MGKERRAVVCIATPESSRRYPVGLKRLSAAVEKQGLAKMLGSTELPKGSPTHAEKPYVFKAYALAAARDRGFTTLLWADASILPVQDMTPLWERIESQGYWFSDNGFKNYQWTSNSAYPVLFPDHSLEEARELNKTIPHITTAAFGLNLMNPTGYTFFREFYDFATKTDVFSGPWQNTSETPCGPPDVLGHRHDQTVASYLVYCFGMQLTAPPDVFAYGREGEASDPRTILLADGNY